jgi:hypothetical protein
MYSKPRKMIEIYYKNNNVKKYKSVDEIDYLSDSIFSVVSTIQI